MRSPVLNELDIGDVVIGRRQILDRTQQAGRGDDLVTRLELGLVGAAENLMTGEGREE